MPWGDFQSGPDNLVATISHSEVGITCKARVVLYKDQGVGLVRRASEEVVVHEEEPETDAAA